MCSPLWLVPALDEVVESLTKVYREYQYLIVGEDLFHVCQNHHQYLLCHLLLCYLLVRELTFINVL